MSFYFPNIDPVYLYERKGDSKDPFLFLNEKNIEIVSNKVTLKEIPHFKKEMTVTVGQKSLEEIDINKEIKRSNEIRVDYTTGLVHFHSNMEGKKATIEYYGTGYVSFPASRIWMEGNEDPVKTLQDIASRSKEGVEALSELGHFVFKGEYDSSKTYKKWNFILHDNKTFVATARVKQEDPKSSNKWQLVSSGADWVGEYNSNNTYSIGDMVSDSKGYNLYMSKIDKNKSPLSSSDNWVVMVSIEEVADKVNEMYDTIDDTIIETKNKVDREVSVFDFGATGDGENDDTKAIQKAFDLASKSKSLDVTIPDGEYRLTDTLTVKGNTHIKAGMNTRMIRDHKKYLLMNGESGDQFKGYNGNSNITIDGGVWDFNGTKHRNMQNCFAIGHSESIRIQNITIKDVVGSHAIEINSSKNVQVLNSNFLGYIDPGSRDFSEAVQIDLAKGAGYFGSFGSYDHTPCKNIVVDGCYFGNSDTAGTKAWARGVGSHASTIGRSHNHITITNNTFEDLSMQAVRAFNWNHMIMSNNQIVNCGSALNVVPPKKSNNSKNTEDSNGNQTGGSENNHGFIVSDNVIKDGGDHSSTIRIRSEDDVVITGVEITGNTVYGKKGKSVGIHLYRVEKSTVSNNTFDGVPNASGITLEDCYSVSTSSNSLNEIGTHGINIVESRVITVSGNTIDNCGSKGVNSDGCQQVTITGNSLKRISTYGIHIHSGTLIFNITGNTIVGAGKRRMKDGSQCIRITTKSSNGTVSGNLLRKWTDEYVPNFAMWITSTTYRTLVSGNNAPGLEVRYSGRSNSTQDFGNSWDKDEAFKSKG